MARTKPKPKNASKPETPWPAVAVELRALTTITPYANNPRAHSPAQIAQLAASIKEWGWTMPLLVDEHGELIAGHGRWQAALSMGLAEVPCMTARGWTDAQKRAYVIADNQLTLNSTWNTDVLRVELAELALDGTLDVGLLGFDKASLDSLTESLAAPEGLDDADTFADTQTSVVTRPGDCWLLDEHRVVCGDSTDAATVAALHRGELADVVHADPPYGMGKELEGVANDNLTGAKLDTFQMSWIRAALACARDNASFYVWGLAPALWRLWWRELHAIDRLTVRAEIVWDKGTASGQGTAEQGVFATASERCLFFVRGPQGIVATTVADFWEGYAPLLEWLCTERDSMFWSGMDVNRITGSLMYGHWFTKAQFAPITERQYAKLREAAAGAAFTLTFAELQARFPGAYTKSHDKHDKRAAAVGSYFDNVHENMTDVWSFPRVLGEERYGHATPKPVAMVARALVSACPPKGLVYEPFLGSGSTLIAAQLFGRRCFGVELEPRYVDLTVRRWQEKTGRRATHADTGVAFDTIAEQRAAIDA